MSPVIAVLCDATLKPSRNRVETSRHDSLSLETSGWYLESDATVYSFLAALVALPIATYAFHSGSVLLLVAAIVIAVVGLLAGPLQGPASTGGAHVTAEAIRFTSGRLRTSRTEVPLSSVVDVWVDPRPYLLPDIGNITVQYGPQEYLHFPGVRHAEAVRRQLLARRDHAVARLKKTQEDGAADDPRRITMR